MSEILISVCIPVYNVEKYIERCARSLFEQTMKDGIEFIFVDDCSPDHSIEILERVLQDYPERKEYMRILHHDKNQGLACARNTAVAAATGEYVLHVDSDDYLAKDALQLLYSNAVQNNADIVVGDAIYIYQRSQIVYKIPDYSAKEEYIKEVLCRQIPCNIWAKLIRRTIYTENSIQVPENLNMGEDFATIPRLLYYAHKISFLHKTIYFYEQRNISSYTKGEASIKKINNILDAVKLLLIFFSTKEDIYKQFISTMFNYNLAVLIACSRSSIGNLQYLQKRIQCFMSGNMYIPVKLRFRDKLSLYLFRKKYFFLLVFLGKIRKFFS